MIKAMLASDYDESKLDFPLGVQPKIDGVRGLNMEGKMLGRSGKPHKNVYNTNFFSTKEHYGFDGELAANLETHPDLCRITSSAMSTIKGEPFILWWVFDYLVPDTMELDYMDRYLSLKSRVNHLQANGLCRHVRVVPMQIVHNLEELRTAHAAWAAEGYEGTIIRKLTGKHKQGRSTIRESGLLRIKDFVDGEFTISKVVEGEANENEAQTNELGNTFRSSHQENKVANGMVGSFLGIVLKDVEDPSTGKVVLFKGQEITVSAGKMDHTTRKYAFENKEEYVGNIGKFKFFPKGIKDKPRFPTFFCVRSKEDI
jgi:DNA ligase-1